MMMLSYSKILHKTIGRKELFGRSPVYQLSNNALKGFFKSRHITTQRTIEECKNFNELSSHFSHRKVHKIEDVNRYCEMIQRLMYSHNSRPMLANMHHFLIDLDLKVLPFPILANLCGAVSVCIEADIRNFQLENNLREILTCLDSQNVSLVQNMELLKMVGFVSAIDDQKLITSFHEVLTERISKLKFNEKIRLLQLLNNRKTPLQIEVKTCKYFFEVYKQKYQNSKFAEKVYWLHYAKRLNRLVYNFQFQFFQIMKNLAQDIPNIKEIDVNHVINLLHNQKLILNQLIKYLLRVYKQNSPQISKKNLVYFLLKIARKKVWHNIDESLMKQFMKILWKEDYFQQKEARLEFISSQTIKAEYLDSVHNHFIHKKEQLSDSRYLWLLIKRNGFEFNYYIFLEDVQKSVPSLNSQFIRNCLVLDHLNTRYKENERISKVLDQFKLKLKEFSQNQSYFFAFLKQETDLTVLQTFQAKFYHLFLAKDLQNQLQKQKPILNSTIFFYLFTANDWWTVQKFLQKNQYAVTVEDIATIIRYTLTQPEKYRHSFNFLFKLIIKLEQIYEISQKIFPIFSSNSVLQHLNKEQIEHFLKAATVMAKIYYEQNKLQLLSFFVLYVLSHERYKNSDSLNGFLLSIQGYQNLHYKFPTVSSLCSQMIIERNLLTKQSANLVVRKDIKNKFIKQYLLLTLQRKSFSNEFKISQVNASLLYFLLKFGQPADLMRYQKNIKSLIQTANSQHLYYAILNFDVKKHQKHLNILQSIVKKYLSSRWNFGKFNTFLSLKIIIQKVATISDQNQAKRNLHKILTAYLIQNVSIIPLSYHHYILHQDKIYQSKKYLQQLAAIIQEKLVSQNYEDQEKILSVAFILIKKLQKSQRIVRFLTSLASKKQFRTILEEQWYWEILIKREKVSEGQVKDMKQLIKQMSELGYRIPKNYSKYLTAIAPEVKQQLVKLANFQWPTEEISKIVNFLNKLLSNSSIPVRQIDMSGQVLIESGNKIILISSQHHTHDLQLLAAYLEHVFQLKKESLTKKKCIVLTPQLIGSYFSSQAIGNDQNQFSFSEIQNQKHKI